MHKNESEEDEAANMELQTARASDKPRQRHQQADKVELPPPTPKPHTRIDTDINGESMFSCCTIDSRRSRTNKLVISLKSEKTEASWHSLRSRNPKLGFLDKPRTKVLFKHTWPHMSQNPWYVPEALSFNQLSFPQFVGGECRTILKTNEPEEVYGRLRILSKTAYLYEQCRDWNRARSAYFTMLSSIEEGDANWASSFGHYDLMYPAPAQVEVKVEPSKSEQKGVLNKTRGLPKKEFFCKEFQKGECNLSALHRAWIHNNYELVDHFCLNCSKAKLGKLVHTPGSEGCVMK